MKLSDIQNKSKLKSPRLVIYGPAGIGKTSFAASLPAPIFVQTEDGLGQIDVPHFPLAKTFEQVMDALDTLINDEHKFKTVCVDSIDWLEGLVWKYTCQQHGKNSIEEFGFGKGYVEALGNWRKYIDKLNTLRDQKSMVVCQIAHAEQKVVNQPDTEPFDRWQIKLNKRASDLVQEHADLVGFCNTKTVIKKSEGQGGRQYQKAVTDAQRYLHCHVDPARIAKNRYGITEALPLDWPTLAAAIKGETPKSKSETEVKEAAE